MGSSSQAVDRGFRVAGLVWAPAWLLNIAASLAADHRISKLPAVTGLLLACATAAWFLLLLGRIRSKTFIGVLWVGAVGQLVLIHVGHLQNNYLYLTGVINSVVVLAGLLVAARVARLSALVLVACAISWLGLQALSDQQLPSLWRQLVIAGFYAVVDVMVVSAATSTLRSAANQADAERVVTAEFEAATARRRAVNEEHQRLASLLHDTLINTLGAIRRGVHRDSLAQLQTRCRRDLERIDAFASGIVSADEIPLSSLAFEAGAVAESLGLQAQVSPVVSVAIPADIAGAVHSAVAELLVNVSKHAGDTRVEIRFGLQGNPVEVVAAVRDFGPGWDGRHGLRGFTESVARRIAAVGGWHSVEPAPQRGTWVSLVVPLHPVSITTAPAAPALGTHMPAAVQRTVIHCGLWWLSLGALQTILAWGQPSFSGSLVAFVLLAVGLAIAGGRTINSAVMRPWLQCGLSLALAVIVAAPQVGMIGCGITQAGAWGPDGAVGIVMAMVLLGRGILPVVFSILGFALGLAYPLLSKSTSVGECGVELLTTLLIEIGTVFAVHLFRSRAENLLSTSKKQWQGALQAVADEAAETYRSRALATRLAAVSGAAGQVLKGIADGASDPLSLETQQAAGAHEQALRGVLALDPELNQLGDEIAACLMKAALKGKAIRILAADVVVSPPDALMSEIRTLLTAVSNSPSGREAPNISIVDGNTQATLSIVASISDFASPRQPLDIEVDTEHITYEVFEEEALVTFTWSTR